MPYISSKDTEYISCNDVQASLTTHPIPAQAFVGMPLFFILTSSASLLYERKYLCVLCRSFYVCVPECVREHYETPELLERE